MEDTHAMELHRQAEAVEDSFYGARKRFFIMLCITNACVNLDGGVLPATLSDVMAHFTLNYQDTGVLGMLVYVGVGLCAPIAGFLLTRTGNARAMLLGAVAGNAIAALWFAWAPNRLVLLAMRFFLGVTQAPLLIYSPVWVDEFAPPEQTTFWMSMLQASVAIGIMVGYLVGGMFVLNFGTAHWPDGILLQAMTMALLIPCYMMVPTHHINAVGGRKERVRRIAERLSKDHKGGSWAKTLENPVDSDKGCALECDPGCRLHFSEQLKMLFRTRMYIVLTLALTVLYFVVTGIQFWAAKYLTESREAGGIGAPKRTTLIAFAVTSLTAPTLGVILGGSLTDHYGGYKDLDGSNRAPARTLRMCTGFCVTGVILALPVLFSRNFWIVIASIWLVLFFGGAMLSPAMGVCINAVSTDLRSLSSATSTVVYNLLGYALSPWACGIIAQQTGLQWGFRSVMMMPVAALVLLTIAWRMAEGKVQNAKRSNTESAPLLHEKKATYVSM